MATNFISRHIKRAFHLTGQVPGLNSDPVNGYQCPLADVRITSYKNIIPAFPVHHSTFLGKREGVIQFCLQKARIYWHDMWLVRILVDSAPQKPTSNAFRPGPHHVPQLFRVLTYAAVGHTMCSTLLPLWDLYIHHTHPEDVYYMMQWNTGTPSTHEVATQEFYMTRLKYYETS
jgi:hypothetical protein